MKNETSINNSKHVVNNSSLLTAENSSKNSKFNIKRNSVGTNHNNKYSNTALFENPKRDFSKTITNRKSQKGIYITDVTLSKFRDTELETKTTIETTKPNFNQNYKTYNKFLKNRNKATKTFTQNMLPNITSGFNKHVNNPPCFTCCDRKMKPEFLTHLYNEQLANNTQSQFLENKTKKGKKNVRDDKNEFLRKTNEIKRIKYEIGLKKEAMEEYKENIKMQRCGIEFTISNLKTYKDNLENSFLTKYNDDLRKIGRELYEQKLKSDMQNNKLAILKNEVSSIKSLIIKKENMLKNIEKWLYLQMYIKEGEEPKNIRESLKKYNNKLIFESLEELNNSLTHKENRNLRLIEKYNKSQNEKDEYALKLLEQERDAKNMDQSIDLMIEQKENLLNQLKKIGNNLNSTINSLSSEKDKLEKNKINKGVNNKITMNNSTNNVELQKNDLGIFYKPIIVKNNMFVLIDCIYSGIIANNIKGLNLDSNYLHQINNINIPETKKTAIKMKVIEISLNYLISSINKKILSDKNNLTIMEKTCKLIDLYHKKINGNKNRMQMQKNWDNLIKKIEDKNKKTYYLPRGKIEKYNIVSIQKKKNDEQQKHKKTVKKIDIWDFLYDQSNDYNDINDNFELEE